MTHDRQRAARAFLDELLRSGLVLTNVCSDLLEDLPEDAFGGESAGEALLDMMTGSIRPVADAAGLDTVASATALIAATLDRVIDDLKQAARLARATEAG